MADAMNREAAAIHCQRSVTKVTVLLTSADYGFFLSTALDSVLLQTRPPDQLLFYDDGSVDYSLDIWAKYRPLLRRRIADIKSLSGERRGRVAGLNYAMQYVTGDAVVILDADDILSPVYLQVCEQNMDNFDVVYTDVQAFGLSEEQYSYPNFDAGLLERGNFIAISAMFRRELFGKTEGFRDVHREDHDFWKQCSVVGARFGHIPERLLHWRKHPFGCRTRFGDGGREYRSATWARC